MFYTFRFAVDVAGARPPAIKNQKPIRREQAPAGSKEVEGEVIYVHE